MRPTARPRLLPGPRRGLGVDLQPDAADGDRQRVLGQPLPVGDGGGEDVEHRQGALDPRDVGRVLGGDVQAGHEVARGREHDVGLAQRRQHPADVVEERRVGADDEDAVALDALALGVEQVGDAVQRHHGLPGAGAALDHGHARVVEPDDLVLLGLDGRDDVAHALAAGGVDRGEQRRVPAPVVVGPTRARTTEHLVGEPGQPPSVRVELPSPAHVLRVRAGGDVERPRRRGPPVEQQRLVVVRPRRGCRSGRCRWSRPRGSPGGRSTVRCPRRRAVSSASPRPGPGRRAPSGCRRCRGGRRGTRPRPAPARRRAACRARRCTPLRTAVPRRNPETAQAPHVDRSAG